MEKEYYKQYQAVDEAPKQDSHTASHPEPAHTAGLGGLGNPFGALGSGLGNTLRSFALDDIILLALILFLLNSDTDDNLPIILLIILFMVGFQKGEEDGE